jgi:hypothetical protein
MRSAQASGNQRLHWEVCEDTVRGWLGQVRLDDRLFTLRMISLKPEDLRELAYFRLGSLSVMSSSTPRLAGPIDVRTRSGRSG